MRSVEVKVGWRGISTSIFSGEQAGPERYLPLPSRVVGSPFLVSGPSSRKLAGGCLGPSPVRSQRLETHSSSAISLSRPMGTPRLNQLFTCWGVTPRFLAKSEAER